MSEQESAMEMDSRRFWKPTVTQEKQWQVEAQVFQIYQCLDPTISPSCKSILLEVQRDNHMEFLTKGLRKLSHNFSVLDASRPWLCYWIIHSIALLGESVDDELENDTIDFLNRCQDPNGGYGGGPGQMPHLATTYAAVNTLLTLGGHKSLSSINRVKLYALLLRMKDTSGCFRMHEGGELDVRACYTAISVASVLNILDEQLVQNVGNYILSCQTYEGGIAGEPSSEAHGGYTFCGLATMILINEVDRLDLPSLIDWVVFRQGVEGGFQGRTNKLVDGCYSFWQGGVCVLIQRLHSILAGQLGLLDDGDCCTDSTPSYSTSDLSDGEQCVECPLSHVDADCHLCPEGQQNTSDPTNLSNHSYNFIRERVDMKPLFESGALQQYLLLCSQVEGGFRDKPGKNKDHYHTCYCMSGLSVSQYSWSEDAGSPPLSWSVLGPYNNLLEPIHPLYNIVLERYYEAHEFFLRSS